MSETTGMLCILGLLAFHAAYVWITESRKPPVRTIQEMLIDDLLAQAQMEAQRRRKEFEEKFLP